MTASRPLTPVGRETPASDIFVACFVAAVLLGPPFCLVASIAITGLDVVGGERFPEIGGPLIAGAFMAFTTALYFGVLSVLLGFPIAFALLRIGLNHPLAFVAAGALLGGSFASSGANPYSREAVVVAVHCVAYALFIRLALAWAVREP